MDAGELREHLADQLHMWQLEGSRGGPWVKSFWNKVRLLAKLTGQTVLEVHQDLLRDAENMDDEEMERTSAKKGKAVNPWAVCHESTGPEKGEKFERCCLPGTLVTMEDGTCKPIEGIKVGDLVFTHRGRVKSVTEVMSRPVDEEILKIRANGLPVPLRVTSNHPLFVLPMVSNWKSGKRTEYEGQPTFIEAGQIKLGDALHSPSLTMETPEENIDEETAFVLGVYAAEGDIEGTREFVKEWQCGHHGTSHRVAKEKDVRGLVVNLSLHKDKDKPLMKFVGKYIDERYPDTPEIPLDPGLSEYVEIMRIKNRFFAEFCARHCGEGAKTKKLSQTLMSASPAVLRYFLAGYFKGDGCTYDHWTHNANGRSYVSKKITSATSSLNLAHQLFWLTERCGLVVTLQKRPNRGGPQNRQKEGLWSYGMALSGTESKKLANVMGQDFDAVTRKGKRFAGAACTFGRVYRIDKEHYTGPVYNMEVADDESYIADLASVHNCVQDVKSKHKIKKD
jgi:intein/homing endonuclease